MRFMDFLKAPEPIQEDVDREQQLNQIYIEMGVFRNYHERMGHVHLPLLQAIHDRLKELEGKQ